MNSKLLLSMSLLAALSVSCAKDKKVTPNSPAPVVAAKPAQLDIAGNWQGTLTGTLKMWNLALTDITCEISDTNVNFQDEAKSLADLKLNAVCTDATGAKHSLKIADTLIFGDADATGSRAVSCQGHNLGVASGTKVSLDIRGLQQVTFWSPTEIIGSIDQTDKNTLAIDVSVSAGMLDSFEVKGSLTRVEAVAPEAIAPEAIPAEIKTGEGQETSSEEVSNDATQPTVTEQMSSIGASLKSAFKSMFAR